MTEEARNLIAESLDELCVLNLPKGRVLYVPYNATQEQIEKAIAFFDNECKREAAGNESGIKEGNLS